MSRIVAQDLYYLIVMGLILLDDWFRFPAFHRGMARTLGTAAYFLSSAKKRQIKTNLDTAFGAAHNPTRAKQIVRGCFTEFWTEMFGWSRSSHTLAYPALEIIGIEHLEAALARGRGVILWESSGFGHRLFAKKILHQLRRGVIQVHGPNNLGGFLTDAPRANRVRREWVKPFFDRREQDFVRARIDLEASGSLAHTRKIMAALARNQIVCAAGDGRVGQKQLSLCFLGQHVPFSTGLVSMAQLTGAVVLTMFCYRLNDTLRLEIGPPIDIPEQVERHVAQRVALQEYVARLERLVRRFPDQYRNWHLIGSREVMDGARHSL